MNQLLACLLLFTQAAVSQTPPAPLPALQIPASPGLSQPNYELGPGDTVQVTVWTGNEYIDQRLTVAADGTLFIPFFVNKLVSISGMTSTALRQRIREELQQVFVNPVVQVVTVGFESKKAVLMGEVQSGEYTLYPNTTILNFMVQHGGAGPRANLAEIQVQRRDQSRVRVNLYDVVLRNDQNQNVMLQPGDVVYVPSQETVGRRYYMIGEVRSPGVLQSVEDLTLKDAITRSGTLTTTAQADHVFVVRTNAMGGSEILDIPYEDIYRKGDFSKDVPLSNGDIVYVPRNGRARLTDALATVTPIVSFIRDTVFLGSLFGQKTNVTVTTNGSKQN